MHIGCHLPTQGPVATRNALTTFCQQSEKHEIDSLWVSDHVVFPTVGNANYPSGRFPHAPHTPYLEPIAVLAAAAMCTERARIGSSVFILGHRNPVVMAKMLTTIDNLIALDFRRDDLSHMLEVLDLVATELRPAVQAA